MTICRLQAFFLSFLLLNILYLVSSSISRRGDGDTFPLICKQCEKYDSAVCIEGQTMCRCKEDMTYFKDNTGEHNCVINPSEIEGCNLFIVDLDNNALKKSYFNLATGLILGEILHKTIINNKIIQTCKIKSGNYWTGDFEWKNIFATGKRKLEDFNEITINKKSVLRFVGDESMYSGLLVKMSFSCKHKVQACLIFKVIGEMKTQVNNTMVPTSEILPTITLPTVEYNKKQKPSWLIGVIVGISILVLLVIVITCLVCYYRKKQKGEHKNKKKRTATSNQILLSTGGSSFIESEIEMIATEHDGYCVVYADPDVAFEPKEKPKDTNYDYPYHSHSKVKKKTHGSTGSTGSKHDYADVLPSDKSTPPYHYQSSKPCPEGRKSLGYALLDGKPGNVVMTSAQSDYQALLMFQEKQKLAELEEPPLPPEPDYVQLEDIANKQQHGVIETEPQYAELDNKDEFEGNI